MMGNGIASWIFGPQIIGLIFFIVGSVQHLFPPKHINNWYGYKMPSAQKNQQTWDEANKYSSVYTIKCGLTILLAGLVITIVLKEIPMPSNIKQAVSIFLFMVSGILPSILIIASTEKHLEKTFNG